MSLLLVIIGLSMHALYQLLKALSFGNIGAPSDIGGGLIPLVGYLLIVVGLARLGRDLWRHVRRHRGP